ARHPLGDAAVLDLGCGTGEMTARLAANYPSASFVGADLEEPHLERARARCAAFGARVRFEIADALALPYADSAFDYVVCRHVIQAVPDAARAVGDPPRAAPRRPRASHRRGLRDALLPPHAAECASLLAGDSVALRGGGGRRSPRRTQDLHHPS